MSQQTEDITDRLLVRLLWNVLWFVIGAVLYAAGVLIYPQNDTIKSLFKDVGLLVANAAAVFFLFSWVSERHSVSVFKHVVGEHISTTISDIFFPLSNEMRSSYYKDFSFFCHLVAPNDNHDHPKYIYQHIHITFVHPSIPKQFIAFIGYSNDNNAVAHYNMRKDCFLRWEPSFFEEHPLDVNQPNSYRIYNVSVNGVSLIGTAAKKEVVIPGGFGHEHQYTVPDTFISRPGRVSLSFYVRKMNTEVLSVITRLAENAVGARFALSMDNNLKANSMFVYTTECTPLLGSEGAEFEISHVNAKGAPVMAEVIFDKVLQRGSNIRFEIRRSL
jgi:hypothetical protein